MGSTKGATICSATGRIPFLNLFRGTEINIIFFLSLRNVFIGVWTTLTWRMTFFVKNRLEKSCLESLFSTRYDKKTFSGLFILRQVVQFFQSARRVFRSKNPSSPRRLHPTPRGHIRVDARSGCPVFKHQLRVLVELRISV